MTECVVVIHAFHYNIFSIAEIIVSRELMSFAWRHYLLTQQIVSNDINFYETYDK